MSNHSEPSTPFTTSRYVRNLVLGLVYVLSVACFMRLLVGNQANTMNYADQEQREHCGFSKKGSWGEMAEKSCVMDADGKCVPTEASEEKTACEGDCANKADCKGDCAHKGECKGDCKGPEVTEDKEAAAAIHGEVKEVAKKEASHDKKSEEKSKKKSL